MYALDYRHALGQTANDCCGHSTTQIFLLTLVTNVLKALMEDVRRSEHYHFLTPSVIADMHSDKPQMIAVAIQPLRFSC